MSTYQLMPNLTADEYDALKADVKERGVMVPVEIDERGSILDGHHRAAIAEELGIDYPKKVRAGWTEEQKVTHVLALNLHRRQLSRDQRAELVADLRQRRMSLRAIGKAVGVDAATVHADLARVGNPTPEEPIQGLDGKSYRQPDPEVVAFRRDVMDADPGIRLANLRLTWAKTALRLSELVLVKPEEYVPHLERADLDLLPGHIASARSWLDGIERELEQVRGLRVVRGAS